jgi:hypothetical protein
VSDNAGNSAFRNPMVEWLARHIANEPHFCCAYNQTREQVLCSHVDLADLSPENLREKLALLTPGSGKALWLSPFRGIAQSNVDSPIDLLFLDCSNCVMAMAESFPIAQPTTCNWPAGTALALPVQSIASSGTLPGDQLVLCSPEEMESRFAILRGFGTDAGKVTGNEETQDLPINPHNVAHHPPPIRNEAVQLTNGEEILEKHAPPVPAPAQDPPFNLHNVAHHPPPIHNKAVQLTTGEEILENHAPPSPAPAVPEQSPARTEAAENSAPANGRASSKWNWLHWLLSPENPDKRMFPRENLPWVAAYFFNGGPPAPASVRNISLSGMFVVTTERWYLGTIIRFTLADWRAQPPDRYVTINAEAVRWGDDGVGLRFLYQKPRRGEHNRTDPSFSSVTPRQLYEFIQCLKPGTSSQSQRN